MDKALLQQLLDALIAMQMEASARSCGLKICDDAIAAGKAAIAKPRVTQITWNADGVRTVNGVPDYVAQPEQPAAERNFCERCGKRLGDSEYIHTCTPPADQFVDANKAIAPALQPLTDEQIEAIGHRKASTYTHRSDPTSHAYGFVRYTLINFARAIEAHIKAEKD